MITSINEIIKQNNGSFYVFDIDILKTRVDHIRSCFKNDISICYAVKANTFLAGELIENVDRFEICSPGEENICHRLNVPMHMMVISGVYKEEEQIKRLIMNPDFDGIITCESKFQYDLIEKYCRICKRNINVLLRITNDSQFGMDEEDILSIYKHSDTAFSKICGIQYFSGTQKTSLKKINREIEYLDKFISRLVEAGFSVNELEYGAGLPVSYFKSDNINDEELMFGLDLAISDMTNKPHITIELGRSIAACCGKYYAQIAECKCNKGKKYVMIDGGMHHLSYFGQQMGMKEPFMSIIRSDNKTNCDQDYFKDTDLNTDNKGPAYIICGSLCSMNDIICKQANLDEPEAGDYICFENTGAYSITEGISLFLSRDIPAVFLKKDGKFICVRNRLDTYGINCPDFTD